MTINEQSFPDFLAAARAGGEWAWAEIYRTLAGQVTGYLAGRGAREPEDLTSEVFLQVARNIHGFEGDHASFRSWVFVIAHRKLLDERRKTGRRPLEVEMERVESEPDGDVEEEAIERLVTAELAAAFDSLSDGQRDVLALRVIAGLTLAETAQVVGKSVGAVKAMQRRAIEALQERIERTGSIQTDV